jgi:cytochrome c oxidase subunit 2
MANSFHDYVCFILILIIGILFFLGLDLLTSAISITGLVELQMLELWWTILPGVLLVGIAYPSLKLLYLIDEIETPALRLDTLGHQWFWEYSYPEFNNISFESYMDTSNKLGRVRLMEVDNRVVIPAQSLVRLLVSSVDVLHSWAIPSLGVKVDAVPGRINQLGLENYSTTLNYGQCSEICGANHRFMPIVLEVVPRNRFLKWVAQW